MKYSNRRNPQRKISSKRISHKKSRKRISHKKYRKRKSHRGRYKKMRGRMMANAYEGEQKEPSLANYYRDKKILIINPSGRAPLIVYIKRNDYTLETLKEDIKRRMKFHFTDFNIFDETTNRKIESIEEFENKKKYYLLKSNEILINAQLEKNVILELKQDDRFESNQDTLKKLREVYNLEEGVNIKIIDKRTGNIVTDLEHNGDYIIRVVN